MVEMFVLFGGSITLDKRHFLENAPKGLRVTVPVPFYLYRRGREAYLVDSGLDPLRASDPAHLGWGEGTEISLGPGQTCVECLTRLGLSPGDLEGVILSHARPEHSGGLRLLGEIPVIAPEREADRLKAVLKGPVASLSQETEIAPGLRVIPTPGCSEGHQSVLVDLDESGPILLTMDAAELAENYETLTPSPWAENPEAAITSFLTLRSVVEETGAYPIFGHDPIQWTDLKKGPQDPYR